MFFSGLVSKKLTVCCSLTSGWIIYCCGFLPSKLQLLLCILVGHGKSEGARVDIKDFQHYVDDLLKYVDMVKGKCPDLPLFIMGHSMVSNFF